MSRPATGDGGPTGQPGPIAALPKGDWQTASATLVVCTRHRGLCAYRQGDPDRCDYCHTTWQAAARWPEWTGKADHLADHDRTDALLAIRRGRRNGRGSDE